MLPHSGRVTIVSPSLLRLLTFLIIILTSLSAHSLLHAEENVQVAEAIPDSVQLNEIKENLKEVNRKKEELKKALTKKENEENIEEIQLNIEQLNKQKKDYNALFEQITLGGIDTSRFVTTIADETKAPEEYNWQKELIQIMQPVFNEMQKMTEVPRKRDQLREEKREIDRRVALAQEGLEHIQELDKKTLSAESLASVNELEKEWQDRLNTLEHQQKITDLKLQDLIDKSSFTEKLKRNVWGFIKGRGLILVTAFSLSIGLYYLLTGLFRGIAQIYEKKRQRIINFKGRLLLLISQLIVFLASLVTLLMILHASGDMVLFGLAVLILFALLITFRSTIPTYLRKLRLFLNLGKAREGERVIYNNLPWMIDTILLYAVHLKNPALDNGKVRITIDMLDTLISRPVRMDEIWFPSRAGDSLILPDGKIVKVLRQTPESVYLNHDGATIIYPTVEFYNLKSRNISKGYTITNQMVLNIAESKTPLAEIPDLLREGITRFIAEHDPEIKDLVRKIKINFKQLAAGNNAHYRITTQISNNATQYYYRFPDLIQNGIVVTADTQAWTLISTEILP